MDNLKVFKKMGRFITTQINAMNDRQVFLDRHSNAPMGLESRLIVDVWNIQADHNNYVTPATC